MGVGELLDRIRALYTERLSQVAEDLGKEPGARVLSEVALRGPDGHALREGGLGLPMRVDVVLFSSAGTPETRSVDSDRVVRFDPVSFAWAQTLHVSMHPFQWDALSVCFQAPKEPAGWKPLVEWYLGWFREGDDGDGASLLGVVHFLSEPEVAAGGVRLKADLGSAPVQAFEGMLDAIAALGVDEVLVGEFQ